MFTLLAALFQAGACAAYGISESELNQQLTALIQQRQLDHRLITLDHQQQQIQLEMQLYDVQLRLLEQQGGIARVGLTTDLTGQLAIFEQPIRFRAQLEPQMESGLRYADGALYLVRPRLTRLDLKGTPQDRELLQPLLAAIQPTLEQELAYYFDRHPVYRLENNMMERLAAENLESVAIRDGRLEFNFKPEAEGSYEDNF
ncbi:DUF1439 domain-containing protein [Marinobacterium arenosum]|uniref:DUF1439 domain-containing protein n=1 Tax=Marinobacterium arenosum TaxID=2862496 RepID=UPI001C9394FF|nr:DUF1439 domain-containing protein [Marinobacterium arenosum]MBY4678971.1 DUF1439 domain-containing protein [Marinobacterium arenosum]